MSSDERENLTALLELLDEADASDVIMKAEVLRELERFAEAQILLSRPFEPALAAAAATIRDLAMKSDPFVRIVGKYGHEPDPMIAS